MFELSDINLGALVEIDRMVKEMAYGEATINVKVADGQIRYFVSNNFKHTKYKDNGTQEALRSAVDSVKEATEEKLNGTVTVTFLLKNGEVKEQTTIYNYTSTTIK